MSFVRTVLGLSMFVGCLVAGCGLALDYDPPTDAGGGPMDTPGSDAGCGVCPAGTTCIAGDCRHPCTSPGDCHFDDGACETCDTALGACIASDVTCGGGCSAACDPVTDVCAPRCPMGESCVGGTCTTSRPCRDAGDCADLTSGPCGRAQCVAGFCQDVLPAPCPDIAFECAEIDACNGCAIVPQPERCASGTELCSGPPAYRCIECTNADLSRCAPDEVCSPTGECTPCTGDLDCVAAGRLPVCDAGRCVACRTGGDCLATGTGAACLSGVCVGCLTDSDCVDDARPVCEANTCVACRRDGDCPLGLRCYGGTCRGCTNDSECPPFLGCDSAAGRCRPRVCSAGVSCPRVPCAGAGICVGGRCTYPGAAMSDTCNDGVHCTMDTCAPDSPDADANGCRFQPVDLACANDLVTCTAQTCEGSVPGADGDGCVTRYLDRLCTPGLSGCGVGVCAGRIGGTTGDVTGCERGLDPRRCGPGQLCSESGSCDLAPDCPGCTDDGVACNGQETCLGGACVQIFDGTGSCWGQCGEYCDEDGSCGVRPSFGGAVCGP